MRIILLSLTLFIVKIGISQCSVILQDVSRCTDSCQGKAIAVNPTGTEPFTYLWSNGLTTETATNLCADSTYSLVISDADNCQYTAHITIQSALSIDVLNTTDASCPSCCDGTIEFTSSGGFYPYYYEARNLDNNIPCYYPYNTLCSGSYEVCITDSHNCRSCTPFSIESASSVNLTSKKNDTNFYPNPTDKIITIETSEEEYEVVLLDNSGKVINRVKNAKVINLENYSAGKYIIRLIGRNTNEQQSIIVY